MQARSKRLEPLREPMICPNAHHPSHGHRAACVRVPDCRRGGYRALLHHHGACRARAGRPANLAGAELAANAQQRIDDNAAKRGVVFVRRPIHAIRNRAVLDACGRSGTSGTAFINDGKNVGFALPLGRRAGGYGRVLDDSSSLKFLDARSGIGHVEPPRMRVAGPYSC